MKNHTSQIIIPTVPLITPGQAMLAFEWWNQQSVMEGTLSVLISGISESGMRQGAEFT
jgi:hypothetical protein